MLGVLEMDKDLTDFSSDSEIRYNKPLSKVENLLWHKKYRVRRKNLKRIDPRKFSIGDEIYYYTFYLFTNYSLINNESDYYDDGVAYKKYFSTKRCRTCYGPAMDVMWGNYIISGRKFRNYVALFDPYKGCIAYFTKFKSALNFVNRYCSINDEFYDYFIIATKSSVFRVWNQY
jgi:hypothetical protein